MRGFEAVDQNAKARETMRKASDAGGTVEPWRAEKDAVAEAFGRGYDAGFEEGGLKKFSTLLIGLGAGFLVGALYHWVWNWIVS